MASTLKRILLRPIPIIFSDSVGLYLMGLFSGGLKKELGGILTDEFLEILLRGMDLAFCLCSGYRKNIENFRGRYLFSTADGEVLVSAVFGDGNMAVKSGIIDPWDTRITFKDAAALRSFIFSQDQDIIDSLLKDEVAVDGNLNFIYKFGFMARDLTHRLGL